MIRLATAQVIKTVDGDTFHSLLDIGWGIILRPRGKDGGPGTVRAVFADGSRYDAPERGTELGKGASAFTAELIKPGMSLDVISFGIDDFGRTLGAVRLPDGSDWAATLATKGFVK